MLRARASAAAARRARLQKDLRTVQRAATADHLQSFASATTANTVEEWDSRGYPTRSGDRIGRPYGAGAQATDRTVVSAESVVG